MNKHSDISPPVPISSLLMKYISEDKENKTLQFALCFIADTFLCHSMQSSIWDENVPSEKTRPKMSSHYHLLLKALSVYVKHSNIY